MDEIVGHLLVLCVVRSQGRGYYHVKISITVALYPISTNRLRSLSSPSLRSADIAPQPLTVDRIDIYSSHLTNIIVHE